MLKIEGQTIYFHSSEHMDEIEDDSITLIVTSPPYWQAKDYGGKQIGFGQSYEEYIRALNKVWEECIRTLQPNGKIAINIQPLPISGKHSEFKRRHILNIMWDIEQLMRKKRMHLSCMFYWNKTEYLNTVSWGSYPKPTNIASNIAFEQIFVWVKEGETRKFNKENLEKSKLKKHEWRHWAVRPLWDDIPPVIKFNSTGENIFGHSAPFPEEISYRIIKLHSIQGEAVLDPFLGSGTTLKVCRATKRVGIGYEVNRKYESLIKRRIVEPWKLPTLPQKHYKTMGCDTFGKIVEATINEVVDVENTDKAEIFKLIIKTLSKEFPKTITPAFKRNVLGLNNNTTKIHSHNKRKRKRVQSLKKFVKTKD